jgi:hypothetical protein
MNHELWSCVAYGVEFIDENGGGRGSAYKSDTGRRLSRPGNKRRTALNFIGKSGNGREPTANITKTKPIKR